jgi:hypothetical protein
MQLFLGRTACAAASRNNYSGPDYSPKIDIIVRGINTKREQKMEFAPDKYLYFTQPG